MSPPYIFRIDEIGEDVEALTHFDNQGNWKPSTDPGANRFVGGGVSGKWWFCDTQRIYEIPNRPPTGCYEYKKFSLYFVGGVGFWVLRGDATRPPSDDVWHPLRFDHHPTDYSSFLTNAGQHSTLRVQRPDQRWPTLLLPDIYHTHVRTPNQNFGGLTGELPIFLALLAFSTTREYLGNILPTVFSGGAWIAHQYPAPRSSQRGVVVTVYTSPSTWAGGSSHTDLNQYELGLLGKYFN